jgi:predicted aspartyl protease
MGAALIAIIVVVLAAIGGTGYLVLSRQKDSDTKNSVATTEASKTIEAECKKEIDDKDFCKFASKFTLDESYKATMVNTSPEGSSTMVIEVDANQNSRTVSTSNGTEIAAFVYLNKTTYVKDYTDGA